MTPNPVSLSTVLAWLDSKLARETKGRAYDIEILVCESEGMPRTIVYSDSLEIVSTGHDLEAALLDAYRREHP